MIAAGVPLLLHLLNLRRLKTVEFSTLRFLQELQQTQVRRLKLQQLLLLVLRTLLIIFAVLAFARPTIPSNLPLLASNARSSVVILVDNSGSMEAADQNGQRLQQAKDNAKRLIAMLNNGDEVCVLPMVSTDPFSFVGFTRTFAQANDQVDAIGLSTNRASMSNALHDADELLKNATNTHRELFVVSDAQAGNLLRQDTDTGIVLTSDASVFLLTVGDGLTGLEQNLSIDSVRLITRLPQSNKPIEVEAFIRNSSTLPVTGALVSMAFQGVRAAQRALDIPAGGTRSIILAAPIQRSGANAISVELEPDAINADNVRYLGVTIPPPARTAVVGTGMDANLVVTALSLPAVQQSIGAVRTVSTFADIAPALQTLDVVYIVNSSIESTSIPLLKQFVERGGGLVVFANEADQQQPLLQECGIAALGLRVAPKGSAWKMQSVNESHPLLEGVFKNEHDRKIVESPYILRQAIVNGGTPVMTTDVGPLLTEGTIGVGRVLFFSVGVDDTWGSFGSTGLFPATVVRAAIYMNNVRGIASEVGLGTPITVQLPARYSGEQQFRIVDVLGATLDIRPAQLAEGTTLTIPGQPKPGVVLCSTTDGTGVASIGVNPPTIESELVYASKSSWLEGIQKLTAFPKHVVTANGRSVGEAIRTARQGSELWPLCIVVALLCAVAESLMTRFGTSEKVSATA